MFLLSSSLSILTNTDSLRCNWNSLFSGIRIEDWSHLSLWLSNKAFAVMENFLGFLTPFVLVEWLTDAPMLLKKVISQFHHNKLRCSNYTKKLWIKRDQRYFGKLSLNLNKLDGQFLYWIINEKKVLIQMFDLFLVFQVINYPRMKELSITALSQAFDNCFW